MDKRSTIAMIAATTGLWVAAPVSATISFTFQDPSSAREFVYTEGDDQDPGHIHYNTSEDGLVLLTIDASEHGIAPVVIVGSLEIDLDVGQATDLGFGKLNSVDGLFRFYGPGGTPDEMVLEGVVSNGTLLVIGTTGGQLSSSTSESLTLNPGPLLQQILDTEGLALAEQMDSSFSLSGINLTGGGGGAPGINEFGYLESFSSNAAYVGNAGIVPSPPAAITLTALACVSSRRRRKAA